jgi:hypothetical protein
MKLLLAIASVVLFAFCSAPLVKADTLLECKGNSLRLRMPITYEVAIDGTRAEVDGKPYQLSESAVQYTLTGPVPANDTTFAINRLTGEWYITPSSPHGDAMQMEYSAQGEEGCRKASQKF